MRNLVGALRGSSHILGDASVKDGVDVNSDGRQQSRGPLATPKINKISKAKGNSKGLGQTQHSGQGLTS